MSLSFAHTLHRSCIMIQIGKRFGQRHKLPCQMCSLGKDLGMQTPPIHSMDSASRDHFKGNHLLLSLQGTKQKECFRFKVVRCIQLTCNTEAESQLWIFYQGNLLSRLKLWFQPSQPLHVFWKYPRETDLIHLPYFRCILLLLVSKSDSKFASLLALWLV